MDLALDYSNVFKQVRKTFFLNPLLTMSDGVPPLGSLQLDVWGRPQGSGFMTLHGGARSLADSAELRGYYSPRPVLLSAD